MRGALASRGHVIPWEGMTDQQKEDHLTHAHGWSNHPAPLNFWHEIDHARIPGGGWAFHTHDKRVRGGHAPA